MHGLILVDAQGNARSTLTTWQDRRAMRPHPVTPKRSSHGVLTELLDSQSLQECGRELRGDLPLARLFDMRERGELAKGLSALSLADYVVAALCRSEPCTEFTNAHATGAFNLTTMDWDRSILDRAGLMDVVWPRVRRGGDIVGELVCRGRHMPCFTPVGDFQCALVGAQLEAGELSLNVATGGQVGMLTSERRLGQWQTRPYCDGRFVNGYFDVPAGRALELLVRLLSQAAVAHGVSHERAWSYVLEQAAEATPPVMRMDLSFFECSTGQEGSIEAMREEEMTVGGMMRAAIAGLAEHFFECACRVDDRQPWRRLVLSGGLAQRIPLLRTAFAERFGRPMRVCEAEEATLLGLSILAEVFSGRRGAVSEAQGEYRSEPVVPGSCDGDGKRML
jgi:sugar (pentulose or hexulose) kinase